ncbi:hypothetical protein [Pseudomonas costantinii]|uniref:Uncharacterized protein n=1 Tax=Pseudomonas costantinii TaxID=168469 RepID=A0A1S2V4V0_9PSED|nr:hypothetical protein [Pseudomonas costantinii]NVZ19563.1 hypothetical protein [Pseudomonas costantinii]OIN53732.1 hypothetical protein BFL40_09650 [Pseudomonas costantinii]SEE31304.1 hypothetical protein SAMN04515675_4897 [Pseudomonas costantinii]
MLESKQHTPKAILRQVIGWVLVLPLLVSFVRLPFPLGLVLGLGAIAASAYGVRLARRHASRRVTVFALIVTLLNVISLVVMGTASVLMGLYYVAWIYGYPHYSSWVYWNF